MDESSRPAAGITAHRLISPLNTPLARAVRNALILINVTTNPADDAISAQTGESVMRRLFFALAALLVTAVMPAAAWEWNSPNVTGAQEYRLFKFYPQASVSQYATRNFDSIKMLTAYHAGDPKPAVFEDIEGRVIKYTTEHHPDTSGLEILRNYQSVLAAKGFETIIAGKVETYPGALLNNGGGNDLIGFWRWQEPGKGMIYVHFFAWANGSNSWLEIVEAKAMEQKLEANTEAMPAKVTEPPPPPPPSPPPVVAAAAPPPPVVAPTAETLKTTLEREGHVALYINFDFDKATLKPDAWPIIGQVLQLLNNNPSWMLAIVGHTDNVGARDYNVRLSRSRAATVVSTLVASGIKGSRLTSEGYGPDQPIADNATPQGQARNRRVELIKR
jgi:outer membrane protein OmpA-like peptidoglycan-associated protein